MSGAATTARIESGSAFSVEHAGKLGALPGDDSVRARRAEALERFDALGIPTRRLEAWKYTDPRPLAKVDWSPPHPKSLEGVTEEDIARFTYWEQSAARIVFVDGAFSDRLSRLDDLPGGLHVEALSLGAVDDEVFLRALNSPGASEDNAFAYLNAAQFADGVLVKVDAKTELEKPIHLLFLATGDGSPFMVQPRNLVVAGERSRFHFVERYVGLQDESHYFCNATTRIEVGAGANVEHDRVQRESRGATHFGLTHVTQARDSVFRQTAVAFGADLCRHEVTVDQNEPGAESTVNGLYFGRDRQQHDNQVKVRHLASHGRSTQLFKGILNDRSTGIFNGAIIVPSDVEATEAEQTNANLLLSKNATANAKPQLQIDAEDVKCSHGATIGALDAAQLFYLKSRGIPEAQARSMLTAAFANDIIDAIGVKPMRDRLHELLTSELAWDREKGLTS